MATKSKTNITTTGICNYCNGEFDKAKMTQHLKHCKERAAAIAASIEGGRSEEHTSELQSPCNLVCRLLLEKNTDIHDAARHLVTVPDISSSDASRDTLWRLPNAVDR